MSRRHHIPGLLPMAAALLCALGCVSAWASDAHAAEPDKSVKAKPADLPTAEHKAERKIAALDTLDALRDKLSQRIGATKAVDHKNVLVMQVAQPAGNDLRVSAKPAPAGTTARTHLAKVSVTSTSTSAPQLESHGAGMLRGPAGDGHWSYGGESGPQAWGAMKPDFSTCNTGKRQSPIDIRDGIAVELEPVEFDYRNNASFSVIDTGHTVQVNVSPGNAIQVLGRRYELLQFHFHRPSEERIGGRQFDMVAHLVHKDAEGRLAVIAVLLERGSVQPIVQTIWNNLPLEKGEAQPARATLDLNALLPKDRRYYTYMGSLTTPPCSEGVLWMVMQQPVNLSAEQIDIFARLYPMNARPVQDSAGRLIKQSN